MDVDRERADGPSGEMQIDRCLGSSLDGGWRRERGGSRPRSTRHEVVNTMSHSLRMRPSSPSTLLRLTSYSYTRSGGARITSAPSRMRRR